MQAWHEPGWLSRTLAQIDGLLAEHGMVRTGPAVLVRQWELSAVLRVPTDQTPVWYKMVPAAFRHEGSVIEWLARLAPLTVPRLLAMGDGWFVTADMAAGLAPAHGHPIELLARLQLATIGRTEELLALGCRDRRLRTLPLALAALSQRRDLITAEEARSLRSALPTIEDLCARVAALEIPHTLVHGDLHDDNARWTPDGWQILDWSDTCVAHPVVDLARPLLNVEPAAAEEISGRFAHIWSRIVLPNHLDQVMNAAPALGAAHQIETHRWLADDIGALEKHIRPIRHWLRHLLTALRNETRPAIRHIN